MIIAVDPGNIESAYIVLNNNLGIMGFDKCTNSKLLEIIDRRLNFDSTHETKIVIEMIACYGQRVGKEIFETCMYIGQLKELCRRYNVDVTLVYRKEEMEVLCNGQNNGDGGIRRALIERFAKHDLKNGKGTKKSPDVFYGFAKDIWAAMAVAVTYHDKYLKGECK